MARPQAYTEAHILDMIEMKTKFRRSVIREVMQSYHEFIPILLEEIGVIRIKGWGTYRMKEYPEWHGTHPRTQERMTYPAKKVVTLTMDDGGKRNKSNRGSQLKK